MGITLSQIKDQVAKNHEYDSWLNMYQNTTNEEFFIYEDEAITEYNAQLLQQNKELREALESIKSNCKDCSTYTESFCYDEANDALSKHPNK